MDGQRMAEMMQNPIPENGERPLRATQAEVDQRVDYAAVLLCVGKSKSAIKRFFRENYGVGARQVETYLLLARDRLAEESGKNRKELVSESFGFYMRILSDTDATITEKLSARAKADDLMGLQAPKKIIEAQVSVDDMIDLWVDTLSEEERDAIHKAALKAEALEQEANQREQLRIESQMAGGIQELEEHEQELEELGEQDGEDEDEEEGSDGSIHAE